MSQPFRVSIARGVVFGAIVFTLAKPGATDAAIIGGTLTVSTLVQEMIGGAPASTTLDDGTSDLVTGPLPVVATGELTSTDLEGTLVSQGRGLSELADPTRLDQTNPEEFRLEGACYSNADNVGYVVNAKGTQRREVIFTTPGNPLGDPEIDFGADGTREVAGSVFLSGAVLVWSTRSPQDLTGLQGDLRITVVRDDIEPLFATSLTIGTDENGQVAVETDGPLVITTLTLDDLADTGLLDETTLNTLTALHETGLLTVLAIEAQSHEYTYVVSADVAFSLTAEMVIDLRAPPGGIGIAATLGGPFEDLATFVGDGLADVSGVSVERAINAGAGLTVIDEPGSRSPSLLPCGAFGMEALVAMMVPLSTPLLRRRRNV